MIKLLGNVLIKRPPKPAALKPKHAPQSQAASTVAGTTGSGSAASDSRYTCPNASSTVHSASTSKRNLAMRMEQAQSDAKRACFDPTHTSADSSSVYTSAGSPTLKARTLATVPRLSKHTFKNTHGREARTLISPVKSPLRFRLSPSKVRLRSPNHNRGMRCSGDSSASPVLYQRRARSSMDHLLFAAGLEVCVHYNYNAIVSIICNDQISFLGVRPSGKVCLQLSH